MSLWHIIKQIYTLDTLDTRLTPAPPPAPVQQQANGTPTHANRNVQSKAKPSKWTSWEYCFYILVVSIAVPWMLYKPYSVSQPSHSQWAKIAPLLSKGWIPGRKVDNSDAQYATFRDNVPYLAALLILQPLLRQAYNLVSPKSTIDSSPPAAQAEARFQQRTSFDVAFGIIFLLALNGTSAAKVLLIFFMNYSIAKGLPTNWVPAATWTFNLAMLAANELCHGYPYADVARWLSLAPPLGDNWGNVLDSYGGLNSRWEVLFNITTLRLISFNLDYYWSLGQRPESPLEKKGEGKAAVGPLTERERVSQPAPAHAYGFFTYLAYTLYAPLFLAGPILTFNDYVSQSRSPPPSLQPRRTMLYGVRFLVCLLTMEVLLHYIYVVAISKVSPDWSAYTPFELAMLGFFNLNIIWLKLLIPWRFFRLWSLIDGIDPPENMLRCVANNFSTLAFWRSWHRSFNRWILRYIYIPLGGSGADRHSRARSIGNMLIVFSFVALWHDIQARLLLWGWLVVFFVLPEVVCSTVLFPRKAWRGSDDGYRRLAGIGAVGNVLMMMLANMIGFVMGVDGVLDMVRGIVSGWSGWAFFVTAYAVLFTGVQVMFEIREGEKRRGVDLKC